MSFWNILSKLLKSCGCIVCFIKSMVVICLVIVRVRVCDMVGMVVRCFDDYYFVKWSWKVVKL